MLKAGFKLLNKTGILVRLNFAVKARWYV